MNKELHNQKKPPSARIGKKVDVLHRKMLSSNLGCSLENAMPRRE